MSFHFSVSSHALPVPANAHAVCFSVRDELIVQTSNRVVHRLSGATASTLSSTPLPELVSHLFSASNSEGGAVVWGVGQNTIYTLHAETGLLLSSYTLPRKCATSRRLLAETKSLSFCGLFLVSAQLSEVHVFRHVAGAAGLVKVDFAMGVPKKKLKISALASAPAGVAAIALAAVDVGIYIWRFSNHHAAAIAPDECKVISFASCKDVGNVRALAFAKHDKDTSLLVCADADAAVATLWAWRARTADDADGGSLFCVRKLVTHSPNACAAFHPRLPVCLFVSGSNARCTASLVDLETGTYATKLMHFDAKGSAKLVVSRVDDAATASAVVKPALEICIHVSATTGLIATAFAGAFVEHQLLARDHWGEPAPSCLIGHDAVLARARPLALVPGEGVPLLERFVDLKTGALSTGSITVVAVEASEDSLLLKSHGALAFLPLANSGKSAALFQRATDACFISHGRILVVVSKQFAFSQRRSAASGQAERASPKVALQLEARRVFSSPFAAGGDLVGQGVGDCVVYVAEDPTSGCDLLAFSRNVAPEYGAVDADDFFMLVTRELEASAKDLRRDAPLPRSDAPSGGENARASMRRVSSFYLVDQVDKDRDVRPDTMHVFACEHGERVVKAMWARASRGGGAWSSDAPWLGVMTTRRVLLLSGGARLKIEHTARCDNAADRPTSMAFVGPRALAFTTHQGWGQALVLEAGAVRPLACLKRPCGPVLLVGATADSLVLRLGDGSTVTRPLLPLEALACSSSPLDATALSRHALVRNAADDDGALTIAGATDTALLRMPAAVAAALLQAADPCLLPSTRVALASQSTALACHLAAHHPSLLPLVPLDSAPVDNPALLVALVQRQSDAWALVSLLAEMQRTPASTEAARPFLRALKRQAGPLAFAAKALLGASEPEERGRNDSAAQLAVDAASLKAGVRDRRASSAAVASAMRHANEAMRLPLTGEPAAAAALDAAAFPAPVVAPLQPRPLGLRLATVHDWLGVANPRRDDAAASVTGAGDAWASTEAGDKAAGGDAAVVVSGDGEGACVGYWRFEETEQGNVSNTADLSRFGRHAALSGDARIDFDAAESVPTEHGGRRPAGVLVLSAGASMRVADVALTSGLHGCSIETWVRVHALEAGALFAGPRWSLRVDAAGKLAAHDGAGEVVVDASKALRTMQWTHVCLTVSRAGTHLYVDGKMAAKGPPLKGAAEAGDLVLGGGLRAELFEVRAWAVCREAWEVEAGMRSYLQLADKVRAKLQPPSQSQQQPVAVGQEWMQLLDSSSGLLYYFCKATGESSWVLPESAKRDKPAVVSEWTQVADPQTGALFFYNLKTGESKWTLDAKADDLLRQPALSPPPAAQQRLSRPSVSSSVAATAAPPVRPYAPSNDAATNSEADEPVTRDLDLDDDVDDDDLDDDDNKNDKDDLDDDDAEVTGTRRPPLPPPPPPHAVAQARRPPRAHTYSDDDEQEPAKDNDAATDNNDYDDDDDDEQDVLL